MKVSINYCVSIRRQKKFPKAFAHFLIQQSYENHPAATQIRSAKKHFIAGSTVETLVTAKFSGFRVFFVVLFLTVVLVRSTVVVLASTNTGVRYAATSSSKTAAVTKNYY